MSETKVENKKPGIIKRIFKWIGLTILAILLIAALIFQAPWKVTTLLIIILLACTVLPRPARKWFWLSVGAVVIALIIWVFLPDEDGDWRPYTFDEELAAIEAKRAIPPEENAATIYNQLIEDYNEAAFEPIFLDPNLEDLTRKEPWSSQDYPELAQWLQQQQSTIATLMQAAQKEKCRFPIAADTVSLGQSMERLIPMRRWAVLLIWSANNDIAEKHCNEALKKYIAVLQMAEHLCQQSAIIDHLVAITIEALTIENFNRFIVTDDATEEHLHTIEKALADIKHDWTTDLPKFVEHDKLMAKSLLSIAYEINPEGKVRLSRDPTAAMRKEFPEEIAQVTYWQRKLMKAFTILAWFYFPSDPHKAAKMIDANYEKVYKMAEPDYNWQEETEEIPRNFPCSLKRTLNYCLLIENLALSSQRHYHRFHDIYLRTIAQQRGSQLIIALRRYKNKTGNWPKSLEDIKSLAPAEVFVDPTNDDSFTYKLTEENFMLYSKGKNNIDEDGDHHLGDDWPIWLLRGHKTQREKTNAEQQ